MKTVIVNIPISGNARIIKPKAIPSKPESRAQIQWDAPADFSWKAATNRKIPTNSAQKANIIGREIMVTPKLDNKIIPTVKSSSP